MEPLTLKKLFGLADKFTIPAYQRAYSWIDENWKQFIDDLRETTDHYYMGHFLFEKNQDDQDEYFIIDGQQRMTTVVIFFSCLIHALVRRSDASLVTTALKRTYLLNNSDTQRFHTVDYDDPLFRQRIINREEEEKDDIQLNSKTADSSSEKNIIECRNYFDGVFSSTETKELERWATLLAQSRITYLEVESKVDGAQIFAFQNDRGKDLSNLEVLKSFFMLQIYLKGHKKQDDLINSLQMAFQKIYRVIVKLNTNEDFVLRYFWMAYGRGFNTENPLKEIKKDFRNKEIDEVPRFLNNLAEAFKYVYEIEQSNEAVVENLRRENNLAWSFPVLIKAKVVVKVSENTMNCLLHLLENFTFRAMVRGGRASVESRLNKLIEGANKETDIIRKIRQFISDLQNDYWSDKQLRDAMNSGYIYNRSRACSYLLWRYEESLQNSGYERKLYWIEDETLEHIAPQTEKGVAIANGYGVYNNKDKPENGIESGEWLHSIGNMVLASRNHNSSLGNKPFKEKLESFGKENLLMQQKVLTEQFKNEQQPLWDKDAIESRGKKIIEAGMKIWDINNVAKMLP